MCKGVSWVCRGLVLVLSVAAVWLFGVFETGRTGNEGQD